MKTQTLSAVLLTSLLSSIALAAPKAKTSDVLATVNGVAIKRGEAMDRAWKQYGTAVLNEMADEVLVRQAAESLKVKADPAEVEARFKRVQGQFQDEKAFELSLANRGLSAADLRAQIAEQVLRETLLIKAKSLSASEAEAKEFFDANKDRLGAPAAIRLRHAMVASEKEAADFAAALRAGADFAKLASQVSLDDATKDRGGDLGFISKGMLQADMEGVVFALKPGEISSPVKSVNGYHVFKVDETRPAKAAVYADMKNDLLRALLADKVTKAWPGYLEELRAKAKYEASR